MRYCYFIIIYYCNNKMADILNVDEYFFLYQEGSVNSKRLKKKFVKKRMSHLVVSQYYKSDFDKNSVSFYMDYLKRLKNDRAATTSKRCIGFLSDDNVLVDTITILPPQPEYWDVLFLECDIKQYDYNNKYNTLYWHGVKEINDTRNFVINVKSIDKIIHLLSKCKTWFDFVNKLTELDNVYTITKTFLSKRLSNHVHFPVEVYNSKKITSDEKNNIVNDYNNAIADKLLDIKVDFTNYNKMVKLFNDKTSGFSYEEKYMMLPSISLICIISDVELFIHSFYTFLKLDYPRDKLEFVIIDDNDYEKKIKGYLPDDGRIKIINLTKKNSDKENMTIPIGNKINMGIKYASYNLICHFFDTNIYFPQTFKDLVKCYIVSNKDVLMSGDTGIYCKKDEQSIVLNKFDLGNMMYTKSFWKTCTFTDVENCKDVLVYDFVHFRKDCIAYIPFVHYSFILTSKEIYTKNTSNIKCKSKVQLPFSLDKLVNDNVIESFLLI